MRLKFTYKGGDITYRDSEDALDPVPDVLVWNGVTFVHVGSGFKDGPDDPVPYEHYKEALVGVINQE